MSDYFDGVVSIRNTFLSKCWRHIAPQRFKIDAVIVETITGSMDFKFDGVCDSEEEVDNVKVARCTNDSRYPDLTPLEMQKRVLNIFVPVQDSSPMQCENDPVAAYKVELKKSFLLEMVLEFFLHGPAFRFLSRFA